ncbi:MAG: hypothetical protein IT262_20150 [Saprospiraceae bacterium]|nr:hypothetical protein [Saprospiraceae bacterium]
MLPNKPQTALLSRDNFRNGVFERDRFRCIVCGLPAVDAHHIIERRLFKAEHEKGGYFLDNGASLCEKHHIEAELTTISCQTLRDFIGMDSIRLPAHFWPDLAYDKWGNVITPEGRLKGELYYEMSVQTILKTIHFLPFIIHPPIHHLPWSPVHAGAPVLESDTCFEAQEVVVMLQRGGQPFSGYHNCCHGRRPEDQLPAYLQKSLLHKLAVLDAGMHICGNFSADQVFLTSVWVENECLDWEATKELSALLEIPFPAIMFEGVYDKDLIINAFEASTDSAKTGYDIRLKKGFRVFDMGKSVGRFVA